MNKGIALAGNILTDNVKMIGAYPEKGMLVTIEDESLAVGGAVPNTAMDIKNLDKNIKVCVYGRVGNDDKGRYVLSRMSDIGIDVSGVKISNTQPTSYSDVMTVIGTGERTFFHNRGANKEFCIADIDFDKLDCDIFHIGYNMLSRMLSARKRKSYTRRRGKAGEWRNKAAFGKGDNKQGAYLNNRRLDRNASVPIHPSADGKLRFPRLLR